MYEMFSNKPFFDNGGLIGNVFSTGAGTVIAGLIVIPLLITPAHPNRERVICLIGMLSALANYYSWGLAGNETGVYMAQVVGFGVLLTKPAMSNLVSEYVGPNAMSEAIGGLFSLGHLGSIVGVVSGSHLLDAIGQNAYFILALGPLFGIITIYAPAP